MDSSTRRPQRPGSGVHGHGAAGRRRRAASWPRAACGTRISWLLLCLLALAVTPAGVPAPGAVAAGVGPPVSQASPGSQVSIRPDAGPPQTVATLTGSGFAAGERVVVIYTDARNTVAGGRPIGSATADGNGTIASVEVTIPPSASPGSLGMLSLIGNRCAAGQGCVTGSDRAQAEASLPFAVTPLASAITVDRAVVPAGGTIVVGGSGYEPGTAVTLALIAPGGVLMPLASIPITTTVTGILSPISVSIPPSIAPGIAALDAVDGAGNVAGVPLTILGPSGTVANGVTIEPARAALGTFIRFTAAGLPPNGPVSLTLTGAAGSSVPIEVYPLADAAAPFSQPLGNPVAALTADSLGGVRGGFVLPRIGGVTLGGTPGLGGDGNGGTMVTLELQAAGTTGDSGRGALLLVAGAKIQTFPPVAIPGHPYTTVGSGFVAGESVQVTALDESGTLSQVGQAVAADCQSGTVPFGQTAATQPTPSAPCVSGTFVLSAIAPTPPAAAGGGATGTPAAGFRLSAIGQTSGLYAGARLVTTTAPTLTLRPYVVAPGGSVEVQGHAFAANAALIVRAGGAPASTPTSGASQPDTSGGGSATTVGSCPDNSGASCAARIPASVPVQTDTSGFFSVRLAVPLGTGTGPITIVAGSDSSGAGMDTASTVLTVNTQHALLSVSPHSAMPQQVITVRGSGFASGEAVDLFLAQPGAPGLSAAGQGGGDSAPAPLPDTTLSVIADAFGAISASYPLPNTIAPGSYIVGARGEISDIRALNALVIGGGPTAIPTATCVPRTCVAPTPIAPRPTATPTPCVANGHAATKQGTSCGTTSGGGSAESVAYFAGGSTAQDTVTVLGGSGQAAVRYSAATRQDLHMTNGGDQQVSVVIAYLLYAVTPPVLPSASRGSTAGGQFASLARVWPALWLPTGGGAFQLSRRRALTLMPHSTQVRSINGDIGNGHLVSIIVRFSVGSAPPGFSLASARASGTSAIGARDGGSGAGALARVVVTLVTHRILQVAGLQGGHLPRLGSRICSGSQPCALTLDGGSTAGTILPDGAVASASPAPSYSTVFAEGWIRGAGNPPAGTAATVPLEGTTSLTFFNPQGSAITAQIRFLSPSGPLGVRARVNLVPFGRQTIGVDGLLGDLCPNVHGIPTLACLPGTPARARARPLAAMGLSMVVTAPEPLVVERSLFWGETVSAASPLPGAGGFDQVAGGAATGARAGTPTSQYISYTSTLGEDRATLTLANEGTGVAAVRIDAYTNAGVRVAMGGGAAIRLRPQSRIAIPLGCTDQHGVRCSLPAGVYTIAIASSTPIGAELTQYAWGGSGAVIAASDGQAGQADGGWRGSNGYTLPTCAPAPCRNGGGIMLRVFNPAGTRLVARISTIQSNGIDGVVAYQIGPHATSQLLLPISGIGGVGRASPTGGSGQGDAVAAVVECGGPCVAAAIQGMPGGMRPHAGSGSPQAGSRASSEVLAGILQ